MSIEAKQGTDAGTELVDRVRLRQDELEQTILARILEGSDGLPGLEDTEYMAGLSAAVARAIDHTLLRIKGDGEDERVPPELIAQAQRAARMGTSLDMVLRRYVIGSTVMSDFIMQEAERMEFPSARCTLREALNVLGAVLDHLLNRVASEYEGELESIRRSPERRRAERVRRLLAGLPGDMTDLGYDPTGWHVGVIATGPKADTALRRLAGALGNRLLCVRQDEQTAWGWLGGARPTPVAQIERLLHKNDACLRDAGGHRSAGKEPYDRGADPTDVLLALGEPAPGLDGWRLTHRQAQAAQRVAQRDPRPVTRYADVALLASVIGDDALARSLVEIYLAPLDRTDGNGAVLRETLRAYFATGRNASSAASALGVSRHTVESRLHAIEDKLGSLLRTRQAELEVALRLEAISPRLP